MAAEESSLPAVVFMDKQAIIKIYEDKQSLDATAFAMTWSEGSSRIGYTGETSHSAGR